MPWAAVPKTTVDEHCDFRAGENDVGWTCRNSKMFPIPQPCFPERPPEVQLGMCVTLTYPPHPRRMGIRRGFSHRWVDETREEWVFAAGSLVVEIADEAILNQFKDYLRCLYYRYMLLRRINMHERLRDSTEGEYSRFVILPIE